jgi:hypothetical protein
MSPVTRPVSEDEARISADSWSTTHTVGTHRWVEMHVHKAAE